MLLGRASAGGDFAVQRDDVPAIGIIAVIALRRIPGGNAEIVEVASGTRCNVVVVTRDWMGACFVAAPTGIVAIRVLFCRPIAVDIVAQRVDRPGDTVQ